MPDVDTDGGIWYQWFNIYNSQNNILPEITTLFAYPFGYDLTFVPFSNLIYSSHIFLLKYILGYSWENLILVTNISSLITYPLSAIGAMLLSFYVTKNIRASFIGGLIFGFSFYHVYMGRGQMSINHIEFIPFYILSLLYFLDKKNAISLLASVLLFAIMFKADAYYAFFSGIFSVIIVLFYKTESLLNRIKIIISYYVALLISVTFVNFNFFLSNLYLFDNTQAALTGRNSIPKNELVNILYYFSPSSVSLLFKYFGNFSYFIYTVTIQIALLGFLLYKKNRMYATWMICFLVGIVLSAYIPSLYWINELYFHYFGMFRGVGRIILPTYLFLGLMVAIFLSNFMEKSVTKKSSPILMAILALLSAVVILSSLNIDATWYRTTDFSKIAKLYQPISENNAISVIATYPMAVNKEAVGCPQTYQLLGQIIHNKSYACGASPFSKDAINYYQSISDINKDSVIPILIKYNIDTIFISNKLLNNSSEVNKKLKKDSRLIFIGRYTQPYDKGYVSANDLSRDISVYQIKEVVKNNQHKTSLFSVTNGEIESINKINPYKYIVKINRIPANNLLTFNVPFSDKWEIYSSKFTQSNDLSFVNVQSDLPTRHIKNDNYVNGWTLDTNKIKDTVGKGLYTTNSDKTINTTIIVYFKPHAFNSLGNLISNSTIALIALTMLVLFLKKRYNKSFEK